MSEVITALQELGPSLGSALAEKLVVDYTVKPATARKRIERAKKAGEIVSLEGLRFRYNEQFFYLAEDAGTAKFMKALQKAFVHAGSPLGDCLLAIYARGGLVPVQMFENLSGLPFQGPAKLSAQSAKAFLMKWKFVQTIENSLGSCIRLNPDVFPKTVPINRIAARMRAEQTFLLALLDWLRLQGFITPGKASLRMDSDTPPQFGFFAWDLVSPSYISPFVSRSKGGVLPGFIVADVCLGRELKLDDVQYFINKCISAEAQLNRPFIGMLVADWFEKEAFAAGRKYGLVFTTPKSFGKAFANILQSMIDLLDEQETALEFKGQQIADLLDKLSSVGHLQGLMGNVLADTFELIAGHCIQRRGGKVSYGRKFTDPDSAKPYDTDVLLLEPERHVVAIECKKKEKTTLVNLTEVEHWFCTVVPLVYKELMKERWFKDVPYEFSFWTTSDFHPDALAALEAMAAKVKQYSITWKNGQQVLTAIEETRDHKLKESFKQYFLK